MLNFLKPCFSKMILAVEILIKSFQGCGKDLLFHCHRISINGILSLSPRPPCSAQIFTADRALITSAVVKTVVSVNLVTENFPLDTPITIGPEQSLRPVTVFFCTHAYLPNLRWDFGHVSNSNTLFSGIALASSMRTFLGIVIIRAHNYFNR